ncbi:MAG: glycosyltransferase [Lachnospiraceae bacterium]|nr:glycosyltransferase [Lachnospiraceae bacterium]
MKKLYVLVPCYNEEENIGALVDIWMEQKAGLEDKGYELHIHPIDDCSKDNTKQVIISKSEEYPGNVELIQHEVNKNLRGGLNTAIKFFSVNGNDGDLMCIMDGDNTQSPIYIHDMVSELNSKNVDCVIASRYRKNSDVTGLAGYRKMMSDLARIYYTLILHVPGVRDYTCGYRIYKHNIIKKVYEKFGEDPIHEKSFACMMELLYKVYLAGASFSEVGFMLRYDFKKGESKMNVGNTMKNSLKTAIQLRAKRGMI